MESAINPLGSTTEACLTSVGVNELEFFPHDYSSRSFFRLVDGERAAIKAEVVANAVVHFGEYLLLQLLFTRYLLWSSASIHKNVLLSGMTVKITIKLNLSALQCLSQHLLDSKAFRK